MVIKCFRDLLNMSFKMFYRKAFHDIEKSHFLAASLVSSKDDNGHSTTSTGACLKCGKPGHWAKYCCCWQHTLQ